MALTNFGAMTTNEKRVWDMRLVQTARNSAIWMRFSGTDENDICREVIEFTPTGVGTGVQGVITQVTDLEGSGVAGDNTLEQREERMRQADNILKIDILRNGVRTEGQFANQRSVVNFRQQAVDKLGYWLGDMYDQLAFLTLSGISYSFNTDGSVRNDQHNGVTQLKFADDVSAPTSNRHFRWDAWNNADGKQTGKSSLQSADTGEMRDIDTLSYLSIVRLLGFVQTEYIPSIRMSPMGMPVGWVMFVSPQGAADLKRDPDYLASRQSAEERSLMQNTIFRGVDDLMMVEGVSVVTHRRVFTTRGARALTGAQDSGSLTGTRWGTNGAMADADSRAGATPAGGLYGFRALLCGASVLAKGTVQGWPEGQSMIVERDHWDYGHSPGLAIRAFLGLKKLVFPNRPYRTSDEDFVVCCDFIHGSQN